MNPVKELILNRLSSGSQPRQRDDSAKLGLVVEGGGMRGVVSAGMVLALEQLGMLNTFDAVYGSSAGSINGAFFLARQAAFGTTIYYQNINNSKFIDLGRAVVGKPVMSLDFLLDKVMIDEKHLNCDLVINSPIPLHVLMSSTTRCELDVISEFRDGPDLLRALNASTRIPFVAGPPVEFRGDKYLDAFLYSSIPVQTAIEDGCTHILALLTRPVRHLPTKPSLFEKYFSSWYLGRIHSELRSIPLTRPAKYRTTVEYIQQRSANPTDEPYILCSQPAEGEAAVGRIEKDKRKLIQGAVSGCKTVLKLFDKQLEPVEVLNFFDHSGAMIRGGQ